MARLSDIDTSTVQELERLKEEQGVLKERLAKLDAERSNVSDAVYERVSQDYRTRHADLEEQVIPLREKAEGELEKVRSILDRISASMEKIRLEKEELEVRYRLGEFSEEKFNQKIEVSEQELSQGEDLIAQAGEVRESFVQVLERDESLPAEGAAEEASQEDATSEEAADEEAADEEAADEEIGEAETVETEAGEAKADEAEADEAEAVEANAESSTDDPEDETATGQTPTLESPEEAATDVEEIVRPEGVLDETIPGNRVGIDLDATRTTAVPPPPLSEVREDQDSEDRDSEDSDETSREEFGVAAVPRLINERADETIPLNLAKIKIGRAVANEIRLVSGAVSRLHAEVVLGDEGYEIHDLGSENGTWVNNVRVQGSRKLADQDMIQIGTEVLIYRDA